MGRDRRECQFCSKEQRDACHAESETADMSVLVCVLGGFILTVAFGMCGLIILAVPCFIWTLAFGGCLFCSVSDRDDPNQPINGLGCPKDRKTNG